MRNRRRTTLWACCALWLAGGRLVAQDAPVQVDLSAGRVREMIAADKALIARSPRDGMNYVKMAYTLSDVGAGDAAREWARRATEVAPKDANVFSAEGWVLRHNAIGEDFGRGYDYDGAVAAYRRAIQLDPADFAIRESYAELLDHNRDGIEYGPGADLDQAIAVRRAIKAQQRVLDPEVEENLLLTLFVTGRYKEVRTEMVPGNRPKRDGLTVATAAVLEGSAAAVAAADGLGDPERRRAALDFAAEALWDVRMYGLAADMLEAELGGSGKSSPEAKKMELFRTLKAYRADLPASDPRSPVQRLLYAMISDGLTEEEASADVTRHAYPDAASWQRFLRSGRRMADMVHTFSVQTGLPQVVIRDIILGAMKIEAEEDGRVWVRMEIMQARLLFFVVKEEGGYMIVTTSDDMAPVGHEALYLLRHGREAEAAALLDWRRSQVLREKGDDPLAGNLFGRLWAHGDSGAEAIETASAALTGVAAGSDQMARLKARMATEKDKEDRDSLALLQAELALRAGDGAAARAVTRDLLGRYPDSETAIRLEGEADGVMKDWAGWRTMLAGRLAKHPEDRFLIGQKAKEAETEGDFATARATLQTLLEGDGATAENYNEYAWVSLFPGEADAQAAQAADKAYGLEKEETFGVLHTLACVDAMRGKTGEARQMLLKAMEVGHMAEPNGDLWLGFGLIDEQYGLPEAAMAAYKRVEKPERMSPTDSYVLAQRRMAALAGH